MHKVALVLVVEEAPVEAVEEAVVLVPSLLSLLCLSKL